MDLFGYASEETKKKEEPLAARMRPSTFRGSCWSGTYHWQR